MLGINVFLRKENLFSLDNDLINIMIELRAKAKLEKNYAMADEIRTKLSDIGVLLEDSKEGTKFKIVKKT